MVQRHVEFASPCAMMTTHKVRNQIRNAFGHQMLFLGLFKPITENIFKDCREFVNRVADLVAESLTAIMAQIPDRDSSDNEEKKIFNQFKSLKAAFGSRVKKMHKNITSAWESLMVSHLDLMLDNGKSSLKEYLNKTTNMTDTYCETRKTLDAVLGGFVGFVKGVVRDGLRGIDLAVQEAFKKEEVKKNITEANQPGPKGTQEEDSESKEEKSWKKKLEIAEMVTQGFLGKVTIESIKRKMDFFKPVDADPDDRESAMDDLIFDILMIKNRARAIIHDDLSKDKGSVDLARRSIYTYWADMAEKMYKEKIQARQTSQPGGQQFYKKLWSDEEQLVDTLLNLMEVYS
ncbi:hypothetical protein HNY73_009928 [Argiope bruennichi]|uniref:Uncharacterized protein n=1 Tax=Argiope bruennichi TaxID=94029 RepID=A0A8T0FDV3_ARGBR|nr:hypothetical protein HNY73_009928 [Argiope bruennichi]